MYRLEKINPQKRKKSFRNGIKEILKNQSGEIFEAVSLFKNIISDIYKETKMERSNEWITFDITNDLILIDDIEKITISLNKVTELKVHYYKDLHNIPKNKEPLKIEIIELEKPFIFYFKTNHYTLTKLLKSLYEKEIYVKEYVNNQRVFLGKTKTHEEIQILKKEHKIKW